MSMITTTRWVPRGYAAQFPTKYAMDDEEMDRIGELAKLKLEDAQNDLADAENGSDEEEEDNEEQEEKGFKVPTTANADEMDEDDKPINYNDDDLKEYDLEHYDDEDNTGEGEAMAMFGNVKSLAYYNSNKDDPYITLKDEHANDEEDDEDREELQILKTDNLILAASVEDDLAQLEVYVYEDAADNMYVHHDIMLPAIPLCLEWLDYPVNKADVNVSQAANFVAVGTMDPDIEIWDLDAVDSTYPNAILGQGSDPTLAKEKKKKKKAKKANDEYHTDAVLSLSHNRQHRNLLASASADKTIKLWDLNTTKCAKSYSYHTDKVCSLAWHPTEATVLLSGSYDRTVVASDMRAPDAKAPRWGVESDVENVRWDPHDPNYFYVSTENGILHYHDVRNAPATPAATKPVWTLQAHDESLSSFDINPVIPGFIATGSSDKTVKLWNIQTSGPSMVVSRNLDVGKVFSTAFAPDSEVAFRLAVAGSAGSLQVWDTSTNAAVRKAFAGRVPEGSAEKEDRMVGIADESDSESDDDDEDEEKDDSMDED
ncbi:putative WD repeat-containing protein C17D11.16 [Ceratocystis platani]|uniref:Putative WD repeat-containing protein C17D11.16 n=1 Tax=Ceratocystis fimbriata f. sp. platani TaxID=88771 RepID=A0A0F8BY43_CERFI|nr:putative WD repeat-containing protein C17D11.16 [Ceratocystis platani]